MTRNKWVRFVCCLFVLPLSLVFSLPGAASAATTDVVTMRLSADWIDNLTGFGDADCTLPLAIGDGGTNGSIVVMKGGYCVAGPDLSPGWCIGFEHECSTYSWSVESGVSGSPCATGGLSDFAGSQDGMSKVHTAFGETQVSLGSCVPVEVCLTATTGGRTMTGCAPTALTPPNLPDQLACPTAGGGPFAPPVAYTGHVTQNGLKWQGHQSYSGVAPSSPTVAMSWKFYYFVTPGPAQGNATRFTQNGTYAMGHVDIGRPIGSPGEWTLDTTSTLFTTEEEAVNWVQTQNVLGMGLYGIAGSASGLNGFRLQVPTTHTGVLNQTGLIGITDPANCSYYWGEKIANLADPASTKDEPISPVITEGPPPEPPPTVTEPDPDVTPTDGPSWWGWIGELLKLILNAVKALATAIAGIAQVILDGLLGLFVPDGDVIAAEMDDVSTVWDDTAPAKYLDGFSNLEAGSMSGCGGMPLNVDLGGGVVVDEHLGAACSGGAASAAGLVRVALSAVLVVGGCIACVRAVGSGLGWNPGLGRVDA